MPIELGSTMVFDTLSAFETARDARYESGTLYYGRYGNAATYKLEQMLMKLEGAEAITLDVLGCSGNHNNSYGPDPPRLSYSGRR